MVPTEGGRPLFTPGSPACLAVGALLSLAALVCATRAGWLGTGLPRGLAEGGVWGVALAFGLRAVGEFRYVGFTKRVRDGLFARRDTWLYSPLWLAIALLAAVLALAPV